MHSRRLIKTLFMIFFPLNILHVLSLAPNTLIQSKLSSSTYRSATTRATQKNNSQRSIIINNTFTVYHHQRKSTLRASGEELEKEKNFQSNGMEFPNLSIIGICGSIGSGKSFTSKLLVSKLNSLVGKEEESGISVNDKNGQIAFHIDTDSLAHGVYKPGSIALEEIQSEFGPAVINEEDGTVNRKTLGAIVFSDDQQMRKLEQIVWPHVKTLLLQQLFDISESCTTKRAANNNDNIPKRKIVVVEAAVLLDANWDENHLFDAIWVVKSCSNKSTERLMSHRNMTKEDALKRIEAQLCRRGIGNLQEEIDNGCVTGVIENNGNSSELLWDDIQKCMLDPHSWKDGRCVTTDGGGDLIQILKHK